MKKLILKWLGLDESISKMSNQIKLINGHLTDCDFTVMCLEINYETRSREIGSILEQLQNLDNNEVIMNLHRRIKELENAK